MLRRAVVNYRQHLVSRYSTLAEEKVHTDSFRTNEANPVEHNKNNVAQFYTVSPEVRKTIFTHGGLPKKFGKQVKTFGETCLMVREPALEIIEFIKNTDLKRPTNRYVIYGKDGTGKSLTLAHLLHYGHVTDHLLVHVPWAPTWFKKPKESGTSTIKEGFTDLPLDAAAWLIHFKAQNNTLLSKLNLKTSKDYVWSKRETTPAGSGILELVEHGIARVKFASGVVEALLAEIKQLSTAGQCKTMVAIDGYNAFFYPNTRIFAEHKVRVTPDKITLTQPFLEMTKWDWSNGVVIVTVDRIAHTEGDMESELPRYLLGKEGFEHIDPFIPIKLDNYTDKEYLSCIEYYLNRRWIQTTEKGFDEELKFLSGKNPYKLMNLCSSL